MDPTDTQDQIDPHQGLKAEKLGPALKELQGQYSKHQFGNLTKNTGSHTHAITPISVTISRYMGETKFVLKHTLRDDASDFYHQLKKVAEIGMKSAQPSLTPMHPQKSRSTYTHNFSTFLSAVQESSWSRRPACARIPDQPYKSANQTRTPTWQRRRREGTLPPQVRHRNRLVSPLNHRRHVSRRISVLNQFP